MEPEMEIARKLKRKFLGNESIAALNYALFQPVMGELKNISSLLNCAEARKLFDKIILGLLDKDMPAHDMNPHIQAALELIRELPIKQVSLKTIADGVYLLQSRFVSLFKKNVGVPFRRYLMWQRLLEAVRQVTSGAALTEAAYESGFADSAHLNRFPTLQKLPVAANSKIRGIFRGPYIAASGFTFAHRPAYVSSGQTLISSWLARLNTQ